MTGNASPPTEEGKAYWRPGFGEGLSDTHEDLQNTVEAAHQEKMLIHAGSNAFLSFQGSTDCLKMPDLMALDLLVVLRWYIP